MHYLASSEGRTPLWPRTLGLLDKVIDAKFGEGYWADIDPGLCPSDSIPAGSSLDRIVLIPRERGLDLAAAPSQPVPVHIMIPYIRALNANALPSSLAVSDRLHYMWGEIYSDLQTAEKWLEGPYGPEWRALGSL